LAKCLPIVVYEFITHAEHLVPYGSQARRRKR
jgi:hypothetical protein